MTRPRRPDRRNRSRRGMALINALVIVGAMAAIMVQVTQRGVEGRARIGDVQTGLQSGLYLDAMAPLVPVLLDRDWEDGADTDTPGDIWARQDFAVPIGRGTGIARIDDLQGRFNVNWLTDPEDTMVRAAFRRLVRDLGLPVPLGDAVIEFLSTQGQATAAAYAARPTPIRPPRGPIRMVSRLRAVEGMQPDMFARLRPHIAALPFGTTLNVNTVGAVVLRAMYPAVRDRQIEQLRTRQIENPFLAPSDFATILGTRPTDPAAADWLLGRIDVRTSWFGADLSVTLDDTGRSRHILLYRRVDTGKTVVHLVVEGQL